MTLRRQFGTLLQRTLGSFECQGVANYSTAQLAIRGSDAVRAGSGGRSSVSGVTATIFGCSGFVGRYVAQSLGAMGTQLVLPYRCDDVDVQHLRVMGDLGMIVPVKDFNVMDEDSVKRAMEGSDIVVNLIGADSETWNYSFEDVHCKIPGMLARVAKEMGTERFVHFSALGASPDAPSRRLKTKAEGEAAVKGEIGERATIFKPAPITGPEDRLFKKYAYQLKKLPFVPLVNGGKTKIQPIWIRDVAQAVTNSLERFDAMGKTYHLAGPKVFSLKEIVDFTFDTVRERRNSLPIPSSLAKALAAPGDWLASQSPVRVRFAGLTQDAVDELQMDLILDDSNVLTAKDLDVVPHSVTEGVPIEYLRHFRAGGYDFGSTEAVQTSVVSPPVAPKHQLD